MFHSDGPGSADTRVDCSLHGELANEILDPSGLLRKKMCIENLRILYRV